MKFFQIHKAVISEDESAVSILVRQGLAVDVKDGLGFTPLELSQLLGKIGCQRLLGGSIPQQVKIQDKGEESPHFIDMALFEKKFGIAYRSFLTFPSYDALRDTIANCPYILRSKWLAGENYAMTERCLDNLAKGAIAKVYVKWISDEMGYGLFADQDIAVGDYVGEYTGVVRRLHRKASDHNVYCFHYPTRFWSFRYYAIDALHEANLMRFINHSDRPNVHPECLVDRGLLHQVFIASKSIRRGKEITFDYGPDFWSNRKKS